MSPWSVSVQPVISLSIQATLNKNENLILKPGKLRLAKCFHAIRYYFFDLMTL